MTSATQGSGAGGSILSGTGSSCPIRGRDEQLDMITGFLERVRAGVDRDLVARQVGVHRVAEDAPPERADVGVVAEVLADAGQRVAHVDAERLQVRGLADTGDLQQLRRVERAARQDHFAARAHVAERTAGLA